MEPNLGTLILYVGILFMLFYVENQSSHRDFRQDGRSASIKSRGCIFGASCALFELN